MAPSQLIDTWVNELKKYFNGDLYLILHYGINGSGGTSDPYQCNLIKNQSQLLQFFKNLDPSNANANEWSSDFEFEHVILDEGHAIKITSTATHKSVKCLSISHFWVVTATSMLNCASDMRGILKILWKSELCEEFDYCQQLTDLSVYADVNINNNMDLHILDSELFMSICHNGAIDSSAAFVVLPHILSKIQLHHIMGLQMDLDDSCGMITIGAQIPVYRTRTIDCVMNNIQLAEYVKLHSTLVRNLKSGRVPASDVTTAATAEEIEGHFDMSLYYHLHQTSLCSELKQLF
ncbi:hypothetical protein LOZ57_006735 [Ophidiomyces ophidiicola]|uniref:uncharacterized protein n=1 Tax=Ophidiomyces ophidiicola TaxID=1387563 RepID=UPI0020C3A68E|nr:uncharacterized protein LOZ57_006735 [Ophidiomyces ophidiicola]KAI1936668.1 hypothetical protein LOZ57_006735 [Ophidiomyces ophidiicola]KAI2042614.1 hypothetical protein LOZ43_006780 [Ophidiomyces ophidiicola]